MKIFDKFPNLANQYRESVTDKGKRNLQIEIEKKEKTLIELNNLSELNEATLYFSRNQIKEKINGVDEAYKLLNEMTHYLENTIQEGNAIELTKEMSFDTKKISAIFAS